MMMFLYLLAGGIIGYFIGRGVRPSVERGSTEARRLNVNQEILKEENIAKILDYLV